MAFGVWLAARGGLAATGLGLTAAGALASVLAAVAMRDGRGASLLPTMASTAIAWGAGSTLAFGAALHALRNDREQGVIALARTRGIGAAAYVRARVGGLVALLSIAVGGATLVAVLAATAIARAPLPAARAGAGAVAYSLAFAATLGPVAMAALGARTRVGGYLVLLALVALPEIAAPWTSSLLPEGWSELTSIPAALDAIRSGVASPGSAGPSAVRALAALTLVAGGCVLAVIARMPRLDSSEGA